MGTSPEILAVSSVCDALYLCFFGLTAKPNYRKAYMHVPENNPTKDPNLAGKHRRFATNTQALRHFSSDTPTERAIVTLREWLAGRVESGDVVSVSLLARRAIAVYLSHCAAMYRDGTLAGEREALRKNSRMPNPNPRKRAKVPYRSRKRVTTPTIVGGCKDK
jgi:hypothetical protein